MTEQNKKRRKSSKQSVELHKMYMCDFETVNDINDCRVWASCCVNIGNMNVEHLGTSIEDFFEWLFDKPSIRCFFHNLKFDGEYLLSFLLRNNFVCEDTKKDMTFSTIISDLGQWFAITIYKNNGRQKHKYEIFDSLKKLPMPVSRIAKTFDLPESKLIIDYNEYRPIGHKLTEQEEEYIKADCIIVAKALQLQFSKGLTGMTVASDAMKWYKNKSVLHAFDGLFPEIPTEDDDFIRRSYKGGFTFVNPKFANQRGLKGISFDVNSLYPSRMYYESLPYGMPFKFIGKYKHDKRYPLYIQHFSCAFDLKPNHIPTIQIKKNLRFIPTEYITSTDGEIIDLWLTSVDFELFKEHYEISSITYIDGYKFKATKGLFTNYIDYWMNIKATSTNKGEVALAKLQLNSLYGRFAVSTHRASKNAIIDNDDVVHYVIQPPETIKPVYTAIACFITAYARKVTISSAQKLYDRFIYADTDSLYLKGFEIPENIEIHPKKLGAWKQEHTFIDSLFIRPKTYAITDQNNGFSVKCAGMPDNLKSKVCYENFKVGASFDGKLVPKRCKGGVVLQETTFTIK